MSSPKIIILDHTKPITLDPTTPPFNNYQAFEQNRHGLYVLASTVRAKEIALALDPSSPTAMFLEDGSMIPLIVPCAFNWFSVTLVNYLRLVALVDLMNGERWKSQDIADPANRKKINPYCTEYVRSAVPDIYRWRNKVAAHFAATYPFDKDSLGTIEQSIMDPVSYMSPYFRVGLLKWHTRGADSDLPDWALTETYERLQPRFWSSLPIKPIPQRG